MVPAAILELHKVLSHSPLKLKAHQPEVAAYAVQSGEPPDRPP